MSVDESLTKKKYLTFTLANDKYGIPLSCVREIIGMYQISEVPNVPPFFKGLINLRGKIISVIDLRKKLNLFVDENSKNMTSIIITEVNEMTIGVIIDSVNDVVGFHKDQIEQKMTIQSKISKDFIAGIAKETNKQLVLLLNFDKILAQEELNIVKKKK